MGRVYQAKNRGGQGVALKILLESPEDQEAADRFIREGHAMAAVPRHPNVLGVVNAGQERGFLYLAVELATGGDLEGELERGQLDPALALDAAEALAQALDHVHASGIVHRDLKPANAIRREDGTLALADFGLAKVNSLERLTQTGEMLGTPLYMAPEQVMGSKDVDARADLWALGVILYRALSGELPFQGATATQTMQLILEHDPAPLYELRPELGAGYQELVSKALSKERADRFQSGAEFCEAIRGCRDRRGGPSSKHVEARLLRALVLMSVLAGILGVLSWGGWQITRSRRQASFEAQLRESLDQARASGGDLLARAAPAPDETFLSLEAKLSDLSDRQAEDGDAKSARALAELRSLVTRAAWRRAVAKSDWSAARTLAESEHLPAPQRVLLGQVVRSLRREDVKVPTLEELSTKKGEVARAAKILWARALAESDPSAALALLSPLRDDPFVEPELPWLETLVALDQADTASLARWAPGLGDAQREIARERVIRHLMPLTESLPPAAINRRVTSATRWDLPRILASLQALALLWKPRAPTHTESELLARLLTRIQQAVRGQDRIDELDLWLGLLRILGKSGLRSNRRLRAPDVLALVLQNVDRLPADVSAQWGLMLLRLDIPAETGKLSFSIQPGARIKYVSPEPGTALSEYLKLRIELLHGEGHGEEFTKRLVATLEDSPGIVGPFCRADAFAFLATCTSISLERREDYVRAALELDPASPWVQISHALCLAERGRIDEARTLEQRARATHLAERVRRKEAPDAYFSRRSVLVYAASGDEPLAESRMVGVYLKDLAPRVREQANWLFARFHARERKKQAEKKRGKR